jgi:Flp pilus assembly protein TadD
MKSDRRAKTGLWLAVLLAAVAAAYANHFGNGFHFDDANVIVENAWVRDLRNVPRFFVDPTTYSTLPDHHIYRPITLTTLAIDYRLGHGLNPFWFHFSTFCWYLVLIVLAYFLFRRLMGGDAYAALAAAAIYGLHPANAETVNYINQRADLFCTLGTVASVLWFAARPEQRKHGWYLLPAVIAFFAKPPVLIFPFVFLYVFLFEQGGLLSRKSILTSLRVTWPALAVMLASVGLAAAMTPATFDPGGASPSLYRLTQPLVALHYFKSFFLPTELNADTDWSYVRGALSGEALAGFAFVVGLLWVAYRASQRAEWRPVAFGIGWFFLAILPTSLVPLGEVTNDHRMFFPFVGLAVAAVWSVRVIALQRGGAWRRVAVAGLAVALIAGTVGTRERNRVWRTDESLWRDVVEKSPRNGRGWMNYGLVFMERGDYQTAIANFERAAPLVPNYWTLDTNFGVALGELRRDAEAERHFERSLSLAPGLADPRFFYARWLDRVGRSGDAVALLDEAVRLNPALVKTRDLRAAIEARWAAMAQSTNASSLIALSDQMYRARRYPQALAMAERAASLDPGSAEAFNNMAAAYNAMDRWDDGARAASQAVRIRPGFDLAINNLRWAEQRRSGVR